VGQDRQENAHSHSYNHQPSSSRPEAPEKYWAVILWVAVPLALVTPVSLGNFSDCRIALFINLISSKIKGNARNIYS